jgi:hypothetical protein
VAAAEAPWPCNRVQRRTARSSPTCRILQASYPETTGVTETADRLYVQNLHLPVLGWKPR